jgi:Ser/Thr protein kinase RdoA (MazF antagonist)
MTHPQSAVRLDPNLFTTIAERWSIHAARLEEISRAGNIVFRTQLEARTVYLRLTEPGFRSPVENQAECDFLSHLNREGVAPSATGRWNPLRRSPASGRPASLPRRREHG